MNGRSGVKKILIIDDEKSFCELLSFILKKEGFEVYYFNDPQEALLKVVENIPDLILLDIAMPKLDGFDLLVKLKKDLGTRCPPVIFLTNLQYTDDGTPITDEFSKSLGAIGVIHKTDNWGYIIQKLKESIENEMNI